MRKVLLLFALIATTYASAQITVSGNVGSYIVDQAIKTDIMEDQYFGGYLEISGDILEKSKLRLAPVLKLFVYEDGLGDAINSVDNHYAFSGGLEAGYDFNKNVTFAVGYELPIPDQREGIFEAVVSPTLYLGMSRGLTLKINYDYFINKKLFTYNSLVSVGVGYTF